MTTSLQAHRIKTTLTQDGTLLLDHLPSRAGDTVEVIVLTTSAASSTQDQYALRGTVLEHRDPFKPIAEADWEACQASSD